MGFRSSAVRSFAYLKPKHRNSRKKAQKAKKGRARIAAKERIERKEKAKGG
jgi:hypothetical protein